MRVLVQKFGGTALGDSDKRETAAGKVKEAVDSGYSPVVVVSAMGRKGQAYATDTLLDLIGDEGCPVSPREQDLLLSCGEVISAVVMALELKKLGFQARALTGAQAGILTSSEHGSSRVKKILTDRLESLLDTEIIPVVAGYQGISPEGEITTLGRGGSDTTASVLAYALEAEEIEIYSDVSGFMTADPDLYPGAVKIRELTHKEACELTNLGARIIHPRAAEVARKAQIPIRVKYNGEDNRGDSKSSISSKSSKNSKKNKSNQDREGSKGSKSSTSSEGSLIDSAVKIEQDKAITGVATRKNVIFTEVFLENPENYSADLEIFKLMAEKMISLDMINIRTDKLTFLIDKPRIKTARKVLRDNDYNFKFHDDFCKVSVVGGGMTGQPGVMARVVQGLNSAGIKIYQTVDSHTTISCLVKAEKETAAVAALHEAFNLNEEV